LTVIPLRYEGVFLVCGFS